MNKEQSEVEKKLMNMIAEHLGELGYGVELNIVTDLLNGYHIIPKTDSPDKWVLEQVENGLQEIDVECDSCGGVRFSGVDIDDIRKIFNEPKKGAE